MTIKNKTFPEIYDKTDSATVYSEIFMCFSIQKLKITDTGQKRYYLVFYKHNHIRRRTQVVREKSAKLLCSGSNPLGALILFPCRQCGCQKDNRKISV